MNVEVWKKVLEMDLAVPISERLWLAVIWTTILGIICWLVAVHWLIFLVLFLFFPGIPVVTGLMIDYYDAKRIFEKGLD